VSISPRSIINQADWAGRIRSGFGFVLSPDTSGAEMQLLGFAVHSDGGGVNIGIKTAVGMLLRMTDVLAEHRAFTTHVALQDEYSFDF
jgi:hypothetical protein